MADVPLLYVIAYQKLALYKRNVLDMADARKVLSRTFMGLDHTRQDRVLQEMVAYGLLADVSRGGITLNVVSVPDI